VRVLSVSEQLADVDDAAPDAGDLQRGQQVGHKVKSVCVLDLADDESQLGKTCLGERFSKERERRVS
jgi:hypothetical protein